MKQSDLLDDEAVKEWLKMQAVVEQQQCQCTIPMSFKNLKNVKFGFKMHPCNTNCRNFRQCAECCFQFQKH